MKILRKLTVNISFLVYSPMRMNCKGKMMYSSNINPSWNGIKRINAIKKNASDKTVPTPWYSAFIWDFMSIGCRPWVVMTCALTDIQSTRHQSA